jgi:hypothetical protein
MHSKLGAISLIVISYRMAATATLALESGLHFVRVVPTDPLAIYFLGHRSILLP